MVINVIFIYIILNSSVKKLNSINIFLLNLNNIKLNIIIILGFFSIFFFLKKIKTYSFFFKIILFKKMKHFFIKKFYFGFFKIHPILFYGSLIIYLSCVNKNFIFLKIKNNHKLYMIILSFILGGIWNMSHLKTSLFWSNDSIEILLMMLIVYMGIYTHKLKINRRFTVVMYVILLLFLYLIRINFVYTKHNFFNILKKNLMWINYIYWSLNINLIHQCSKNFKKYIYNYNKSLYPLLIFFVYFILLLNYLNYFFFKLIIKFLTYTVLTNVIIYLLYQRVKDKYLHIFFFLLLLVYIQFSYKNIFLNKNLNIQIKLYENLHYNLYNKTFFRINIHTKTKENKRIDVVGLKYLIYSKFPII